MRLTFEADRTYARARLKRRGVPIAAYTGPNGTGKSAVMVYDTLPSLEAGRPVLSTVRLLDYLNPRPCPGGIYCDDPDGHERERIAIDLVPFDPELEPDHPEQVLMRVEYPTGEFEVHRCAHPLYVRLSSYQQLLDWRDGDVLLDEVTGIASSRESSNMPAPIANLLVQLRRRNVVLRWSAPAWGRSDKIIREVTQAVTLTSAFYPRKIKPVPGEPPRLWRERRLFWARTFDAMAFDEFEAHRADETIKPMVRAMYWGPGSHMFAAYDTYDAVSSLGHLDLSTGACMTCGGKRRPIPCDCDDHKPGRRVKREGAPARPKAEDVRPLPDPQLVPRGYDA